MGIKGLMKLLQENCPQAVKEREFKNFFNRVVAVDASMSLYQFLIAIRSGPEGDQLTNEAGEVTSHLQGMFYRTLRMLDAGIKPVYVFDGAAPMMKSGELLKRRAKREQAQTDLAEAQEKGDAEEIDRYNKRLVRVTPEHNAECRKLLRLMGLPIIEAAGEAEAQCAEMVKHGKAWAVATEDMDALTFGSPRLLRNLTAAEARKLPVYEIDLQTILQTLELTMSQFVELCILCGCDYAESIRGIGPAGALKLIQKHGDMEQVLKSLEGSERYKIPEDFKWQDAKALFESPAVLSAEEMKLEWSDPDEQGLIEFLVHEKGFNQQRIEAGIKKLKGTKGKASQGRIDSFFTIAPSEGGQKRKEPPAKGKAAKGKPAAKKAKK